MPRRRAKSSAVSSQRVLWICAAMLLVGAGFYFGFRVAQPPPPPDFNALRKQSVVELQRATDTPQAPLPQVEPRQDPQDPGAATAAADQEPALGPVVVRRQPPPRPSGTARVAIVIDDLGRSLKDLETLGRLDVSLTYAVLPFEVLTPEVVTALQRRGEEILCHLPMEATGQANPGPGALRLAMSDAELQRATAKALEAVPGAIGANNHMGSAVVADHRAMSVVLSILQQRGLAFLDSRTTAETLGYSLARQMGMPAAERQVFLDTYRDRDFIRRQFRALLTAAEKRGGAIGIAHPYDETLEVLLAEVPKAKAAGFEFIPASRLFDQ